MQSSYFYFAFFLLKKKKSPESLICIGARPFILLQKKNQRNERKKKFPFRNYNNIFHIECAQFIDAKSTWTNERVFVSIYFH